MKRFIACGSHKCELYNCIDEKSPEIHIRFFVVNISHFSILWWLLQLLQSWQMRLNIKYREEGRAKALSGTPLLVTWVTPTPRPRPCQARHPRAAPSLCPTPTFSRTNVSLKPSSQELLQMSRHLVTILVPRIWKIGFWCVLVYLQIRIVFNTFYHQTCKNL